MTDFLPPGFTRRRDLVNLRQNILNDFTVDEALAMKEASLPDEIWAAVHMNQRDAMLNPIACPRDWEYWACELVALAEHLIDEGEEMSLIHEPMTGTVH